jgi:protein PhnA
VIVQTVTLFLSKTSLMGKSYDSHHARLTALALLGKDLARRAKSKCELTGAAGVPLAAYEVPPVAPEPDLERTLLLAEPCLTALAQPKTLAGRSWQGPLAEMIWSERPALQVVAWRLLDRLARKEDWAREVLDSAALDPETEAWAKSCPL